MLLLLLLFDLDVEDNDYVDCNIIDKDGGSDFGAELTNISRKIYIHTALPPPNPNPSPISLFFPARDINPST